MVRRAASDAAAIVHLFGSDDPSRASRHIIRQKWDAQRAAGALIALAAVVSSGSSQEFLEAIERTVNKVGPLKDDEDL